ncbi:MAG: response regulator [Phormidesmis sp.]
MIETNAILEFAEDLIHQKTETYCSELQRRILTAALQEERKTYDQLAEECGYSSRYVKQDVAPKLWLLISQAVGEKVNKANVRAVLEAAMRNHVSDHTLKDLQTENHFSESVEDTRNQYIRSRYIKEREIVSSPNSTIVISPSKDSDTSLNNAGFNNTFTRNASLSSTHFLAANSPAELSATNAKANILLVDDQPQNLKLLSDLLEEQGYEVQQAINGAVALQAVQASPPDLVLLDIHMPQMDGYTLCQYIKADATTSNIPVIFISAIDEAWDKVKAFSAGGCDYITKPFKVVEVLARVENHLKVQQLQKALMEQNVKLQRANQELQRLAAIDEITQVACRRRFDAYLLDCWQQAEQSRTSLTLLLVQLDNFSFYGESESPHLGDQTLYNIAQVIQQSVSGSQDLVARYGTITFAILLPQQTKDEGTAIAYKLIKDFKAFSTPKAITKGTLQPPQSDLKIGIASTDFSRQERPYSGIGEFIEASERTLKKAKPNGNCVEDS